MRQLVKLMVNCAFLAYDVLNPYVPNHQGVREEVSVATPRQRFRTHQRQTVLPCQRDDFEEVVGELFGLHVVGVAAETAVLPCEVDGVWFWTAQSADFWHVNVPYVMRLESDVECFFVELGVVPAAGNTANVHHQGYGVRFEQLQELIERSG